MTIPEQETRWTLLSLAINQQSDGDCFEVDSPWSKIVEIYAPLVVHWTKQLGAVDDASISDISQGVFVKLWKALGGIERNERRGAFRKYVKMTTRSCFIDYVRKSARFPKTISDSHIGQIAADQINDEEFELVERGMVMGAIVCCMEKYPQVAAEAYLLQLRDKLTIKEIAEIQCKNENAVRTAISRLRKTFNLDLQAFQKSKIDQHDLEDIAKEQKRSSQVVSDGIERITSTIQQNFSDII